MIARGALTHNAVVVVAVVALAGSCASTPVATYAPRETGPVVGVRVTNGDDDSARPAWSGPATFTVRNVSEGAVQRVVSFPGLGEAHVGLAGDDDACRFVWSKGGLDRLVLYESHACADRSSAGRVCFHQARFASAAAAADAGAPRSLVVDGCADENDLLWSKVDGAQPATVGPTSFRQRCARLPKNKKGCELTYLKRDDVQVASNAAANEGFAFLFDGEGWRACFLEKEAGAYRVTLDVEDACGAHKPLVLAGSSSDLDD